MNNNRKIRTKPLQGTCISIRLVRLAHAWGESSPLSPSNLFWYIKKASYSDCLRIAKRRMFNVKRTIVVYLIKVIKSIWQSLSMTVSTLRKPMKPSSQRQDECPCLKNRASVTHNTLYLARLRGQMAWSKCIANKFSSGAGVGKRLRIIWRANAFSFELIAEG